MLKRIDIFGFKCFENITIDHIAPITIIGGPNNAGKSAVLEAIMLHNSAGNPGVFWSLGNLRNVMLPNPTPYLVWEHLFYHMKDTKEFKIEIEKDSDEFSSVTISKIYNHTEINQSTAQAYEIQNKGLDFSAIHASLSNKKYKLAGSYSIQRNMLQNFTIQFINDPDNKGKLEEYAKYFNKSVLYKNSFDVGTAERLSKIALVPQKKQLMIEILKIFDDSICDVTTVLNNGIAYIYVIMDNGDAMPINYMGDGIVKAVHILLYILEMQNGILLIDEIENGFYYELYGKLLRIFFETALKVNCQIMMTTHNIDIIRKSLENMIEIGKLDDLCYQRLDVSDCGQRKAYPFFGKSLVSAIKSEMEIR